jgi:hypothetical protein
MYDLDLLRAVHDMVIEAIAKRYNFEKPTTVLYADFYEINNLRNGKVVVHTSVITTIYDGGDIIVKIWNGNGSNNIIKINTLPDKLDTSIEKVLSTLTHILITRRMESFRDYK